MADIVTQRQDLPDWARPYGGSLFANLVKSFFPQMETVQTGRDDWPVDVYLNDPATYEQMGGALRPGLDPFTDLENQGRWYAGRQVQESGPLRSAADAWLLGKMTGGGDDLAQLTQSYTMGGPLAGATRVGLLDALEGNSQKNAAQRLIDSMSGKTSRSAEDRLYGMLGDEGDYSRDAAYDTIGGSLAGGARRSAADTINGRYLDPSANSHFGATVDAGTKAIADAYKYATAPEAMGAAARAGVYGGSAHQQTTGMKQFELGRNLSDFVNQMYADNYSRERQNQLAASNAERGYTQSALEAERGRGYSAAENALSRAQQAALDERGGWRSLLDQQNNRMLSASEGELGRGIQTMSLYPELMKSRYDDADVLRQLGAEERQLSEANKEIEYQNALTKFQWPFNLYNIMGSSLASFTGGGGVQTTTSPNPNAISPVAGALGGGLAGASILSNLFAPRQDQQQPAAR